MKKIILLSMLFVNLIASAQLTIMNNSNRRITYEISSIGTLGNCEVYLNRINMSINAHTISDFYLTYSDFGTTNWNLRTGPGVYAPIAPAIADSTYGSPNWSVIKFKYVSSSGAVMDEGYLAFGVCNSPQLIWASGTHDATLINLGGGEFQITFN